MLQVADQVLVRLPSDPLCFMIEELERIRQAKGTVIEPSSGNQQSWSLAQWLASLGLSRAIAVALMPPGSSTAELDTARSLGTAASADEGRAKLVAMMRDARVLEAIASMVWNGAQSLRSCDGGTTARMGNKFLQGGAVLTYGGLETFFGGLESRIGAPDPRVLETMEREHSSADDSHRQIVTKNYAVTTTSAIEWKFVASPDSPPECGGWPKERQAMRTQEMRTVLQVHVLRERTAQKNAQLAALGEPELIYPEAIGARLYTGARAESLRSPYGRVRQRWDLIAAAL
jgi:hypothetical protein